MKYFLVYAYTVLVMALLSGCAGKANDGNDADEIVNREVEQEEGEVQIVWLLPEEWPGEGLNLYEDLLNQKLKEDGYSFSVRFCFQHYAGYQSSLEHWLEEDTGIDIVSLGPGSTNDWDRGADIIRDGYFEELSSYLQSEEGGELWNSFYPQQWEAVRTDGGIYTVPSQYAVTGGQTFVFNRTYFSEEDLAGFDGTLESFMLLPEMMERIQFAEGDEPLMIDFPMEDIARMSGYEYRRGVFISLETGQVCNPFETGALRDFMLTLHALYRQGYLSDDYNILYGFGSEVENSRAARLTFGVWICYYPLLMPEEISENVITVQLPFYFRNLLNLTTGVYAGSRHKNAAMTLLNLINTNAEYSNLLVYGEEGVNYQLIDGFAYDMNGERSSVDDVEWYLGLYYDLYPYKGDRFGQNRRDYLHSLYESDARMDSILLGFQENAAVMREAGLPTEADLQEVMYEYINLWKEDDIDAALAEAAEAYRAAGGELLVEEYQRQISAWIGSE